MWKNPFFFVAKTHKFAKHAFVLRGTKHVICDPLSKNLPFLQMNWSAMGELHVCLKKILHMLFSFEIKQNIAEINKTYTSLDSPAYMEYKHRHLVSLQ